MEHRYKAFVKSLSRKNWFIYKLISMALNLYGQISFGRLKIKKKHCVR